MNKSDLINSVSRQANIDKVNARKVVLIIFKNIAKVLAQGDKVSLVGFGSFTPVERAARKGRHPQTGKEIQIKAKKVIKFRPGKNLLKQQ